MNDLRLSLSFPQVSVVAGENFPAKITITNTGRTEVAAPADFGDADYQFTLLPVGGGEAITLSRRAVKSAPRPGQPERVSPSPAPITENLRAGESRVAQVFPARLATRPIPTGVFDATVSLISAPKVVSPPVRLKVEAPNIVRHHLTGGGPMSGGV